MDERINGFSLCAGVGGLDLGVEIAFPRYRCIAAVENNPEAAKRFRLRFPEAKVFRDVVGFDGRRINGIVDCVTAGWPCQPHSIAGKRLGTADERWIWGDIARILGESGAPLFFGENVSGLLRDADGGTEEGADGEVDDDSDGSMGGMGTVLRDLAAMGFITVWGSLRASQVGASHGRPRVFVLAYKPTGGFRIDWCSSRICGYANERNGSVEYAEKSIGSIHRAEQNKESRGYTDSSGEVEIGSYEGRLFLGNSDLARLEGRSMRELGGSGESSARPGSSEMEDSSRSLVPTGSGRSRWRRGIRRAGDELGIFAPGPNSPDWPAILDHNYLIRPSLSIFEQCLTESLQQTGVDVQEAVESELRRLDDGLARRLVERRPRLSCGGNGVVPLQAAACFTILARRIGLI